MGVDHRRRDIGVAQQFLYRTYIVTSLKQVCGKGVAQGVHGNLVIDSSPLRRCLDHLLYTGFMQMMSTGLTATRVN